MINRTEQEEREYLEVIKEKLLYAIRRTEDTVRNYSTELRQNKEYMYEHQSGMDEADMVASEQSINRMAFTGESAVARKRKLLKLGQSPYFGRIDFLQEGKDQESPVYIGIYSFADERANLIYDWRAPVSSMFYDFELGPGWYTTPGGKVSGEITLKRQYKIREGQMEFMIENAVNIHDDVLQRELSKASDEKMKNIVATIQRDQNAVIRNETAPVMIIQGVAGSGKTSIALHRIAFLLYRFRDEIAAKDILIISPNKVFADYISNVLPELGEEQIPEMGMDELADVLLENKYRFQTFFEQVYAVLEKPDAAFIERIKFKASPEFLSQLNRFIIHLENHYFNETEIRVAGVVVPWPFIQERVKAYHRVPIFKRFPEVVKDVFQHIRSQTNRKLNGQEKAKVWEAVPRIFKLTNVMEVYREFYKFIGKPEMFRMMHGEMLEYADVFPLIYCRIRLEGIPAYDHVKHLLVDEMQDYTAIQYAVLSRLFKCRKTILGDASQQVNPYSASSAEAIERVFPQGDVVKLFRSYRSTLEITAFAQRLFANPDLIPMERHGDVPQVNGFESNAEEVEAIKQHIAAYKEAGYQSLGIIAKTRDQAAYLYKELKSPHVHLLTTDSTAFHEGVVITTAHLSKGLEFDEVVVPFVSARNYNTTVDKSMLYIACTRAMHKLTLLYTQERSIFI
ncbi:HelD family protein [Dawidia soli]|uniref:AAA family ATPase n=1 Tax=Dawidia soli TaxID=2782352 RepID=A0AAP2GHD3_9BACT|nr:3'-5' exonuclease [Dawidia soli]MBT1685883.1 AAA family ATPase [Dawidia soli]